MKEFIQAISNYKSSTPFFVLITGASGAGKTTLLKSLETALLDMKALVDFYYFDSIGVPSPEDMIKHYGSGEKWQEAMTKEWIERLAKIQNKKLVFLEGQFRPIFALDPLKRLGKSHFLLLCVHAQRAARDDRLILDRKQPELANDDMHNWAEFLKNQTIENKGFVLDTTEENIQATTDRVLQIILKCLTSQQQTKI